MVAYREQRLAQNEALFREVNERIAGIAGGHGDDPHRYEFICECSNADCSFRVEMPLNEYEAVRADPRRFVVMPHHHLPEIERVVDKRDRYWMIEKFGEGGEFVAAQDPRAK